MILTNLESLTAYRMHTPKWASQPTSGQGAAAHGGRANRPGVAALYLSLEYETAIEEFKRRSELLRHGFGEPRYFRLKVVELGGEVAGYAMYFNTYRGCEAAPVLYLEDLYVKPEHRRRGFATQLMAHLAKEALATDCIFMEWNVFAWNEPAIALFEKKLGGELRRELIPVKLKGPEIRRLAGQAQ